LIHRYYNKDKNVFVVVVLLLHWLLLKLMKSLGEDFLDVTATHGGMMMKYLRD